jgi:hypothetical protein
VGPTGQRQRAREQWGGLARLWWARWAVSIAWSWAAKEIGLPGWRCGCELLLGYCEAGAAGGLATAAGCDTSWFGPQLLQQNGLERYGRLKRERDRVGRGERFRN